MRLRREIKNVFAKHTWGEGIWWAGAIAALEWVLGKEDLVFGPLKPKEPKGRRGRPPVGIDDARLLALREKGWSLKRLSKEFKCSTAAIVAHLKKGVDTGEGAR